MEQEIHMPIPQPKKDEDSQKFVSRCMSDETMKKDYKDTKQRAAICLGQIKKTKSSLIDQVIEILGFSLAYDCTNCDDLEDAEEINPNNIVVPSGEDYVDFKETTEEYDLSHIKGSEYQGRKVTLNKPFRTPDGPKKFSVYVKNGKGNVVKVNFGDPNMKIKKNIPERRKSFRARHKCDQAKDKTTPRYWSCKMW